MSESSPGEAPPEWAVLYARGAVRIGMPVPDIEQHLNSRGLSPELANRIVMEIVEGAFQADAPPSDWSESGRPIRLLVCLILGGACMALAYWYGGGRSLGFACIWVVPAMGGVWFCEISETIDSDWGARWWFGGWALLLIYLAYRIFLCAVMMT